MQNMHHLPTWVNGEQEDAKWDTVGNFVGMKCGFLLKSVLGHL